MVDFRKPNKPAKPAIDQDFFLMIIRDQRPQCRMISAIGKKKGIDGVFEWCVANLGQDDMKWISIYYHDRDALVLDIHFFDDEVYQKFYAHYEKSCMTPEEMAEDEDG